MLIACLLLACPAAPQDPFVETRRMVPPFLAGAVKAAATADFDGDLDLDVFQAAAADFFFPHAQARPLLTNLGAGLFESATGAVPHLEGTPVDVAAGDLDGDGDADVVVLNLGEPSVALENHGGTFTVAGELVDPSAFTTAGALGDLDQDGDLDLFVTRRGSDAANGVYANAGGFLFTLQPHALPAGLDEGRDVALGDVDQDGDLDAYLSNEAFAEDPLVHDDVLYNQGQGKLEVHGGPLAHSSRTAALGDLDGDGDLDAHAGSAFGDKLVWNPGGSALWTSTPSPLGKWSSTVVAADLGGDGLVDLMAAPGPWIARGVGGGAFVNTSATDVPGGPVPTHALLHFPAPVALALGDFDGDLDPDILWPEGESHEPSLWLNAEGSFGAFQTSPPFAPLARAGTLAVGDVDGDGHVDLLTSRPLSPPLAYSAVLWPGNGTGTFDQQIPVMSTPGLSKDVLEVALGDLDGDGDLDGILTDRGNGSVQRNDGSGAFTEVPGGFPDLPGSGSFEAQVVVLADVDGDLDLDGAVTTAAGLGDSALYLLVNDGAATFTGVHLAEGGITLHYCRPAFADVDGDGDQDLWLPRYFEGSTLLLENDGAGGFQDVSSSHLPPLEALAVAVGDLDQDLDVDAVLQRLTGEDVVLLNDGAGVFAVGATVLEGQFVSRNLLLGDANGDRILDLVDTRTTNWLMLGDGAGGFAPGTSFGGLTIYRPRWADVDEDRDPDLVGTAVSRPLVYTNVLRGQVARRTAPRAGKPLRMEVFGEPGTPWALAASPGTASLPLGSFGTLLLDPSTLWLLGAGTLPPGGVAAVSVPVAGDPTLVGQTVHWQALTGSPPALTNREATTVTAY